MSGLVKLQVKSWSFSRWSDYENCPAKFKYKYIDRLPEPPNPAMARGNVMHKMAELYVKGESITRAKLKDDRGNFLCTAAEFSTFHKEWKSILKRFKDQFDDLKEVGAQTEISWAFTKDWQSETRWNDWARAWVRIKVDCYDYDPDTETVRVIDYKTGKQRDSHLDQLSLYAIAAFLVFPKAKTVEAILVYFDTEGVEEAVRKETFHRKALGTLKRTWAKRTRAMLTDREFKATPNYLCKWCHYRASNGGPCEHG